jgi:TRAP-type C4-dicarboxylate transport system permease small subunit
MSFTEDNQFFLSVFENEREINIWNNYLGKISSSREKEALKFDVVINRCEEDFRKVLARKLNLVKKEE